MNFVYFGTYTGEKSNGIYACTFDEAMGEPGKPWLAAKTENPTFLAAHKGGQYLYAANEIPEGKVSSFSIQSPSGRLSPLNHVSSGGNGPCHLALDSENRNVLVANYGGGTVAVLPLAGDGRLKKASTVIQQVGSGPNPSRQEKSHPHSVTLCRDDRFALVADLGTDHLYVYRLDVSKGILSAGNPSSFKMPPGAGPRQCDFHPNGRWFYALNELNSTLVVFAFDPADGGLEPLQNLSSLPGDFKGENTASEIQVHSSGRFLYASNRGQDGLALFAIDPKTGLLTFRGHVSTQGNMPRHFGIDPSGNFLFAANQGSDSVVVFRINGESGGLAPTGQVLEVPTPTCVVFV